MWVLNEKNFNYHVYCLESVKQIVDIEVLKGFNVLKPLCAQ
jgi:hypothetical protein